MLLIGDVHGLIDSYWKLLQKHQPAYSLQVGDFGFRPHHEWHRRHLSAVRHKVNFGNHDDTAFVGSPHSTGHYNLWQGVFTIRGAFSIDRWHRTEGKDWWADEELSYAQWQTCIDAYTAIKPDVVVSHDCPAEIRAALFGITDKNITSDGLQACFEQHQPRLWVFGHHHKSVSMEVNGTTFRCLNELETVMI